MKKTSRFGALLLAAVLALALFTACGDSSPEGGAFCGNRNVSDEC